MLASLSATPSSMPSRKPIAPSRAGRPARISREIIAAAALELGLNGITLTAVAGHLGVDHSSLYRHIKDRRDMLLAAADLAIGTLKWRSRTPNWRSYLEKAAESVWALYERYPGLANAIRELDVTPPEGVRAFGETVARLETMGFSRENAILLLDSIMDMTIDSAIGWAQMKDASKRSRFVGETMLHSWQSVAQTYPTLGPQVEGMASVMTGSPHHWWRRKLDLLLAGAAALRAE